MRLPIPCAAQACALALALLLVGCANTNMTARINPETAEDALCAELAKVSAWTCLTYSKVFFIGETYTPEQVQQRMQRSDIDTVLLLKPTDSGTQCRPCAA